MVFRHSSSLRQNLLARWEPVPTNEGTYSSRSMVFSVCFEMDDVPP